MTATPAALQARFGIPGVVSIGEGPGGLTLITITSKHAEAKIFTHGAHLTHYQPAGKKPVLWMSGKSLYANDKAIRGGVPLIFPWFGAKADNAKAPMHGFARTADWEIDKVRLDGDAAVVVLTLESSNATRAFWPHDFRLYYEIRVGDELRMSLRVVNQAPGPFDFEVALHTYLAVSDVRKVKVLGLEGTHYIDKTDALKQKPQGDAPVTITSETDRVYLATQSTCIVDDPGLSRRIEVAKQNSDATVVWNPWIAKAKAMADFGDDEWPDMICVETVNAGPHRVKLAAGDAHTMVATLVTRTFG